jgi:hypothetical protein
MLEIVRRAVPLFTRVTDLERLVTPTSSEPNPMLDNDRLGMGVPNVRVTVRVSVPAFVAASEALIVKTFCPDSRGILLHVQAVVPVQAPLPPRSFAQVTEVTPTLSDAVPTSVIGLVPVPNVGFDVGDVIVTVGGVVSNVTVRMS